MGCTDCSHLDEWAALVGERVPDERPDREDRPPVRSGGEDPYAGGDDPWTVDT